MKKRMRIMAVLKTEKNGSTARKMKRRRRTQLHLKPISIHSISDAVDATTISSPQLPCHRPARNRVDAAAHRHRAPITINTTIVLSPPSRRRHPSSLSPPPCPAKPVHQLCPQLP
ncbi:hypothetical protein M0R45_006872 [Rubus argutus]|uniref:Uncharacterized protein n=1 Tax=Rubus argutus TaxID=59490 RepID=A0AAW1YSJ5_RUBAR